MRKYITKNLGWVVLGNLIVAGSTFFIAMLSYITADLVENMGDLKVKQGLTYGIWYVGTIIGILLFEYLSKVSSAKLMQCVMGQLKCDVAKKVFSMPREEYKKNDTGYYLGIFTEDIRNLYNDYFDCIFALFTSIVQLIVYSAFLFKMNWILALVTLGITFLTVALPDREGKKLAKAKGIQSAQNARYVGCLKELLEGNSLINSRTRKAFIDRHDKECLDRENITFQNNKLASFVQIFAGATLYLINIAVFICGLILISNDMLTVGMFVGLLSLIDAVAIPVRDMMYQIIGIRSAKEIKEKMLDILEYPENEDKITKEFSDKITVRNLGYAQGEFALCDVNLEIRKGRKYAIVGRSGAGKSTLMKLMLGQYGDYAGEILYDGVEQSRYDLSTMVAEISQDTIVFNASMEENITLFGSYGMEELQKYARELELEEMLDLQPGESGMTLSGGEKNKLALLRALCRECKVLFCDEMFSALDEKSKKLLGNKLFLREDFTMVVITHDISEASLNYFDEIILMEDGKVLKQGEKSEMLPYIKEYFA